MKRFYSLVLFILLASTFYGQITSCTIDTNQCFIQKQYIAGKIVLEKKMVSIDTIPSITTPLLADINGDCIPEIIVTNAGNFHKREILFLDPKTGKTIHRIKTFGINSDPTNMLIADIDNDDVPEVFMVILETSLQKQLRNKLICYNLDGSTRWISDQPFYKPLNRGYTGNLGIADFNQDGMPEIYVFNSIFNAQTGKLLIHGGDNGVGHYLSSLSVAANLDKNNSDLELAAGYSVYKVAINNINGTTGNTMTTRNINIDGTFMDGFTAVSDINKDGQLDIIVSGYVNNSVSPILYVYTMRKGVPRLLAKSEPAKFNSFGAPTIGFIDGTNDPSIIVSGRNSLEAYYYDGTTNLKKKWAMNISDASMQTGAVLFDLNNDGIQEIIYRDESYLYIINEKSNNPIIQSKYLCHSVTGRESPIIGDVFGNGTSNICVACSDIRLGHEGTIVVFGSPDTLPPWAPARHVWNQNAYNVLNINDDLTVPQYQKNNATYENGRYNNFMQQQSLLDSNGYYKVRAGSLHGLIQCINYDAASDQYTVLFDIYNRADASLSIPAGMPVAFFNGDPQAGGTLIGIYRTTSEIAPGDSLIGLSFTFSAPGLTQLFMVVNTNQAAFNPIDEEDFLHPECDYLDNFSQNISIPQVEIQSDAICNGDSYTFGDTTLMTSGTYYRALKNNSGCDSLYVSLTLSVRDTLLSISDRTACDSFSWKGMTYTQSGIYSQKYVSTHGCDSTIAIDLTIHSSTDSTLVLSACDSFIWKGTNYTQSAIYTFQTFNTVGCDSTVYLDLTIHPSGQTSIDHTVCQSFLWHDITYDRSGIYSFDTFNVNGCDSSITLFLEIRDTIFSSEDIAICRGDSIRVFGDYVKDAGMFSQAFVTADACDSIHTIRVMVDSLLQASLSRNICDGDSVFVINQWLKEQGNYTIIKSNANDCDSVFDVHISLLQNVNTYDTLSLCQDDTILVFGQQVTDKADLMQSFMATNGCDSLSFVHVVMQQVYANTTNMVLCPGDSLFVGGSWIKDAGVFTETLTAINGCDSIITVEVTALDPPDPPSAELDCASLEITASIVLNAPWSVRWDNGDTSAQTTYNNQSSATLTLFAAPNCTQQFTITLPPIPPAVPRDRWRDTILTPGSPLVIDLGLNPNEWSVLWVPSDIIDCDTCMRVVITPKDPAASAGQGQQITIYFTHISGCIYTASFNIRFVEENIYIPNAFTPNGDGINDSWQVFHTPNITLLHIQVYDRWGDLVFDSDYAGTFLWDGTFNNQNAPSAVYTYVVEYRSASGETLFKSSDLTLIR